MKLWKPSLAFLYKTSARTQSKAFKASPPVVLASGFAVLILLGTLALKLPFATVVPITWLQAVFTATSAVTVTGLVVADTGGDFTLFGTSVIAVLIQLGGIGFMTFAILAVSSLGGKISIQQRLLAKEAMNQTSLMNIVKTAKAVLILAVICELVAAIALTLLWWPEMPLLKAFGHGLFYAISAFNNAGFGLSPDSLIPYASNVPINLIISCLFIVGGLGFSVITNMYEGRRWRNFSVYTKSILITTLVINLVSMFVIYGLEHNNPQTLGGLSNVGQWTAAWFQAVTPRTAGFNSVDIGALTDASAVYMLLLMFIGGGSMSTAGGIKLGTFIILMLATYTFIRRREHVTLMERSIAQEAVMKALAVTMVTIAMLFIGIFVLMILNNLPFIDIAFEVLSASATVGLSRGVTDQLTPLSQCIIMLLMFAGRVGPLTLVYFLTTPNKRRIRYPQTTIQVG
ncbi:MAG: K+ uptake system protein [Idiomarina sp. T82-3]|uniref:TrkH family potassium uptake protein n=1 Tax=Idiomarina TaxID=135575 RepID=UPI00079B95E4|nr:TrkH family potassium uptake protein [Idiomarina sp. T82-3]KXS34411.1 MAG: K+ uptake system protein [Idiomarina sp. T82-3]